jgi:hypothetical protein
MCLDLFVEINYVSSVCRCCMQYSVFCINKQKCNSFLLKTLKLRDPYGPSSIFTVTEDLKTHWKCPSWSYYLITHTNTRNTKVNVNSATLADTITIK